MSTEMRKLLNLFESDDMSKADIKQLNKMIAVGSPGQFIRYHAQRALDRLGIPYAGAMSWVDTGKTATRLKYDRLGSRISDDELIKLSKAFQKRLPRYKTKVYRVTGSYSIAFKIHKIKE